MNTIKEQTESRRPLALRQLGCWEWLLRKLADSRITPNQISVLGMIFGIGAGIALFLTASLETGSALQRTALLGSVGLVILRAACNIFDGVLAVNTGRASRLGLLFNEVPDRVSDVVILIGAGHAVGSLPVLGWAAALGALATAYIRVQVQLAGASADFSGPMAKPARMTLLCLGVGIPALLPVEWWPWAPLGPGIGLIGASLILISVGTLATTIHRLGRASRELEPVNHDDPA